MDDETLQDFLVEASEILEQLGEQLVQLEQAPEDADLLNAVFRGFHTIKGGASFVSLNEMVEVCHRAEDVFNVLRQGERQADATLMDHVLRVLDVLNQQFDEVRNGQEPTAADGELLRALEGYAQTDNGQPADTGESPPAASDNSEAGQQQAEAGDGDITDEEFEALLDALEGKGSDSQPADSAGSGDGKQITQDEFEDLLDELHGAGNAPQASKDSTGPAAGAGQGDTPASGDEITEDEFQQLLDQLHGGGKAPGEAGTGANATGGAAPGAASAPAAPAPASTDAGSGAGGGDAEQGGKAAAKPAGDGAKGAQGQARADSTVRVDTGLLDDIMNLVGELVLVRNRLSTLKTTMGHEQASKAVANLDLVTSDLQTSVMKTRMQPVKKVFGRFPRVVRDAARNLEKEVNLELNGEDTDLDKNLVEALADPMIHLVRNAVDHGIEAPDEREALGKPRAGTVVLSAEQEGDHILLTIADDGKGMDPEALRRKAVEKELMDADAAARLDDQGAFDLIFAPGFSTKQEISDISGRGVGMDVVKTKITQLNGTIDIDSAPGRGSTISIRVPLTLAILPTLMVKVDDRTFALPLSSVSEIFPVEEARTNTVDNQLVVVVRDKAFPLHYLHHWLLTHPYESNPDEGQVVVVNVGTQKVGFVVDHVIGQEEVVIKPLGFPLHGLPGFAGATITGDGRIALIVDVPSLLRTFAQKH